MSRFGLICVAIAVVFTLTEGTAVVAEETEAKNLLGFAFQDANKDGVPDGYKVVKGKGSEAATVTYDETVFRGEKGPSVKMHLPKEGNLQLDLIHRQKLEKGKKYLFIVDVKVEGMRISDSWQRKGVLRCFMIYVYGQNNRHTWLGIAGNGSTKEWVTVMVPFDTEKQPNFWASRVLFRCYKLLGTVWLRNPAIVELPKGTDVESHFILEDGATFMGNPLIVKE